MSDENDERQEQTPAGVGAVLVDATPGSGALRCPECGGTRIHKGFHALLFNLGLGAMFLGLAQVGRLLYQIAPILSLVAPGGLAVSLLALPVTMAIGIAGRHRCRDCGYRFRPRRKTNVHIADARFPLRFAVWGTLVFGAAVIAGVVLVVTVPHRPEWVVAVGVLARVVLAAFAAGVCVVLQAILWRLLRTRIKHPRTLAIALLLPSILLSGLWITWACLDREVFLRHVQPEARAVRILHNGQLAALPDSATDIEVHTWSSPMSGEEFLRFAAEPNDIERFVRESRSLRGKVPTSYSAEHMRVPVRDDMQKRREFEQAGHEVYFPHSTTPDWYKQEITGPARRYIFRPKRYQFDAEVIIDDAQNVVYVYLCFS